MRKFIHFSYARIYSKCIKMQFTPARCLLCIICGQDADLGEKPFFLILKQTYEKIRTNIPISQGTSSNPSINHFYLNKLNGTFINVMTPKDTISRERIGFVRPNNQPFETKCYMNFKSKIKILF